MQKISTLIIDDEFHARENLKLLLTEFCPQINIVGEADGIQSALKQINSKKPHLLFLDIRMPSGAEGFELLDLIPDKSIRVIFITAFKEYAIKAFKANAIDYLLKPVDIQELKNAVAKIKLTDFTNEQNNQYINQLKSLTSSLGILNDKISISNKKGIKVIYQKDIIRLEADGNCTILFFSDNTSYFDTRTLKKYEQILNKNNFYRVHKSHIINLNYVQEYSRELRPIIAMKNGVKIPVSRLKVKALTAILKSL